MQGKGRGEVSEREPGDHPPLLLPSPSLIIAKMNLSWLSCVLGEIKMESLGFSGGAVVEGPPANAGDTGSSPGPGRSHMPRSN